MRILSYVFETSLAFSEPVSQHSFVLRCLPKPTNTQKVIDSQLYTDPRVALSEQIDGFGNRVVMGYCPQEHVSFDFYTTGVVMVETQNTDTTPAHPMYLQPSELTHLTAELVAWAQSVGAAALGVASSDAAATLAPEAIMEVAQTLCLSVHEHFAYVPGTTSVATTAADAFAAARGVCQDYAHVLIVLCRALGIPARYVTGLMVGEGATHAWVEVHDGLRWRGLDPTNNCVVGEDHLMFSTGRDFNDCPIERGVFRGNALQTQTVKASVGLDAGAVNAVTARLKMR